MQRSNDVYPIERVLSALTYVTVGFVGFIWMIIAALLKKRVTPFLMYHIMQSIFLSIACFLIGELYKLVFVIFIKIPFINTLFFALNGMLNTSFAIFYGLSLVQAFTTAVLIYLTISSFMGYYSYIPWVSDIIGANLGGRK